MTHKGASADGGHYIAWVRKDELEGQNADNLDSLKDEWYKFDDDKVRPLALVRHDVLTLISHSLGVGYDSGENLCFGWGRGGLDGVHPAVQVRWLFSMGSGDSMFANDKAACAGRSKRLD